MGWTKKLHEVDYPKTDTGADHWEVIVFSVGVGKAAALPEGFEPFAAHVTPVTKETLCMAKRWVPAES